MIMVKGTPHLSSQVTFVVAVLLVTTKVESNMRARTIMILIIQEFRRRTFINVILPQSISNLKNTSGMITAVNL
jgi:hypothetical protein